jgi:tRNA(Arg) A34 adenosine deaminase TadA
MEQGGVLKGGNRPMAREAVADSFNLCLPEWLKDFAAEAARVSYLDAWERMRLAIDLARRNVAAGTGGPFGAAVFEAEKGRLLAVGVNLVVAARCSILHAEVVALMLAQQRLGRFDLGGEGLPACELVTSAEPCAMCFGALLWSGVRRLVCAAREEDVRAVGFDEGPKPDDWPGELQRRGITVARDLCRDEAVTVLKDYALGGGLVYNPRRSD